MSIQQKLKTEKNKAGQADARLFELQEKLDCAVAEKDRWLRKLQRGFSTEILEDRDRNSLSETTEEAVKDYYSSDSHVRTEKKLIEFRSKIGRRYGHVKYSEWLDQN